ncbi:MAG: electron transfer flavoprotein subunit alpha/FixB family protein [Holosporales bacterium]
MAILVIAEHTQADLRPATANAVGAAQVLGQDIHVLVAGHQAEGAAQAAAKLEGVTQVIWADHPSLAEGLAEPLSQVIVALASQYSHIMAPSTTSGKNVMPRAAALLDVAQISDVMEILDAETFVRPIYAGNALATVKSEDALKVMTIRPTSFAAVKSKDTPCGIERWTGNVSAPSTKFISRSQSESARPELTAARVVVSGGRGVGSAENFKLIENLADCLNAAVGASRAAVDAGFVPNDYQVGQTGKVVAPQLYIAVGISGAIQHLAGMKESKVIVAINKDADAPIFQVADYGIVGDLFQVVPEMIEALR